ncbi:DinB family protein [Cohnella soli]|uniref:DinB family protein n=1 Tax=Cohnella soli TaxID=425005 RepID=A0ABW0HLT0_9BACL
MSQASIQAAKTARQLVIGAMQSIPEEIYDITPAGFNNTIRWNAGHMITTLDWFLSPGSPLLTKLPEGYSDLFKSGTKPSDWEGTPPSKAELLQYLTAQLDDLSLIDPGLLELPLKSPFEWGGLKFLTAGEVFSFAFIHEGLHLGVISSLVKAVLASK